MIIKSDEEIELIRVSSLMVSKTLAYLASILEVGMTPYELSLKAEEFLKDNKAIPSFKGYRGFPSALCVSRNEAVVHGIPDKLPLKETDIVSIDCGAYMNGYHGDSAYTFAFTEVKEDVKDLLITTKASLLKGLEMLKAGVRQGDLGFEIQSFCESKGYSIVRELVGHGLGKSIHEPPDVPNYGKKGKGLIFKKNLVIAIEPMVNLGKKDVIMLDDDWTIVTKDGKPSAHFEHTVCIKLEGCDVLTSFDPIEKSIEKNNNLINI
jgi:methionyl aminopeptidase